MDESLKRSTSGGHVNFRHPIEVATEIQALPNRTAETITPRESEAVRARLRKEPQEQEGQPQPSNELRDACLALARRARNAFRDACLSVDQAEAEAGFSSVKTMLEELWEYGYLRDRPFRDLLALLEAALKRSELTEFTPVQRDLLRQAFSDLPRWLLDDNTVEGHIERFAEHGIDVTGPIRSHQLTPRGKRVVVRLEEIEDDNEASLS